MRVWLEAGRPLSTKPTRCRFDEWEQTSGGILDIIGVPGFLDNHVEARAEMNTEGAAWEEFVAVWHKAYGDSFQTAKTLLDIADKCDDLSALIGEKEGQAARFGKMLQYRKTKIFAGYTITRAEKKSGGGTKWRVTAPLATDDGSDGNDPTHTPTRSLQKDVNDAEKLSTTKDGDVSQAVGSEGITDTPVTTNREAF